MLQSLGFIRSPNSIKNRKRSLEDLLEVLRVVGQLPARISAASPGACDAKWIKGSFGAVRMRPKRQKAQEPWGQSGPEAATCSRS